MTKPTQESSVERFAELFRGFEQGFGEYRINQTDDSGKRTGMAKTIAAPIQNKNFQEHLDGLTGIGVIPLLAADKCWFGAIDIDIKGEVKLIEDHFILEARIRSLKLPLVLCRSKSNGAHLYLFGKEPISARLMQGRLTEFAAMLGYGGCEVFPKQIMRARPNDFGNWINLPYFGGERLAIHNGVEQDLDGFFSAADSSKVSEAALRSFKIAMKEEFMDGPPCLQQIYTLGFPDGSRNNTLMAIGVYMKKKFPDEWQDKLYGFNSDHIDPSLPRAEVAIMIKSLTRKDYNYSCKTAPLANYCNRPGCLKREFGVSDGDDGSFNMPITSITKYIAGDSYRWGVNTGEMMIEFTSDEIFAMEVYRKKFAERLHIVMPNIKQPDFFRQLASLIQDCEVVEDPEDASESGQMIAAVESWFLDTGSAKNHDEMIKGKWFLDPETKKIYFAGEALEEYLTQIKRVKNIQKHKLWRLLERHFKAEKDRLVIKGKRRRVWVVPEFEFEDKKPLEIRKVEKPEEEI